MAKVHLSERSPSKTFDQCVRCGTATWCETQRKTGRPRCLGCKVELFFDEVLFRPKGLRLLDWQRKALRAVYGTIGEDGRRVYRRWWEEVPKKNGKSFLVGGLPLYHLVCESHEQRQEAYGCAAAKDQAGIVYRSAASLARGNPLLTDVLKINESTRRIVRRDGGGFYAVLSADGDVQDGIEPSLGIMDEVHRWRTAKAETLYDVVTKGMISRAEPLTVMITTAGEINDSPLCYREHETADRVRRGVLSSPRLYVEIHSADENRIKTDPEYWKSREARVLANPSHEDNGGFLKDEALVEELDKAIAQPADKPKYLRYHLNIWVQNEQRAIDLGEWDACGAETLPLIDRPCYAGVDLSSTIDLTALMLLFPTQTRSPIGTLTSDEVQTFDLLPFFWMPEGAVDERTRRDRVPYRQWIDEGLIEATEGNVIDYRKVAAKIRWAGEMFELREIALDPWNSRELSGTLIDEGFRCVEIRQGISTLSEPTKKILECVKSGKFRHGGNKVLRWMADCLTTANDGNDNVRFVKPNRQTSSKRIDGFAALANAMSRAIVAEGSSVYDTRGVLQL
jgi:phage terminase large subunit-like protein